MSLLDAEAGEALLQPGESLGSDAAGESLGSDAAGLRCGSNFYVYLCCAAMWPWFMVGRVAHRLRMPGAPLLAFLVMVAYAVYTACLSAMGFVNHPLAFGIGGSVLWVVTTGAVVATRNAFRKALGVPGTCWSDICMSSSCATLFIAPVLWFVILLNLPHTQPSSEASNKAANDLALALTFGLLIFPIAFSFPPCWGLPSSVALRLCGWRWGGAPACENRYQTVASWVCTRCTHMGGRAARERRRGRDVGADAARAKGTCHFRARVRRVGGGPAEETVLRTTCMFLAPVTGSFVPGKMGSPSRSEATALHLAGVRVLARVRP